MTRGQDGRLVGWKAIGNFVGRDERTVRRWSAERGLPVRRVPGGGSATVWADPDELRAWMEGGGAISETAVRASSESDQPRAPSKLWLVVAGAVALLALAPVAWRSFDSESKAAAVSTTPYGADAAANARYREARYAFDRRSVRGLFAAAASFEALTKSHPRNSAAWVGLADTNLLLREFNSLPDETAYRRAEAAAVQALTLDPNAAAANRSLGFIRFHGDGDHGEGLKLLARAVELDPAQAQSHHWLGTALIGVGDAREAIRHLEHARAINSDSSAIAADLAYALFLGGKEEDAIVRARKIAEIDPQFSGAWRYLARFYAALGEDAAFLKAAEVEARLREDPAQSRAVAEAKTAHAAGGRAAMLKSLIASEEARFNQTGESALRVAMWHAIARDDSKVRAWLARAESLRTPEIRSVPGYVEFAPYRDNPAFSHWFKPHQN